MTRDRTGSYFIPSVKPPLELRVRASRPRRKKEVKREGCISRATVNNNNNNNKGMENRTQRFEQSKIEAQWSEHSSFQHTPPFISSSLFPLFDTNISPVSRETRPRERTREKINSQLVLPRHPSESKKRENTKLKERKERRDKIR